MSVRSCESKGQKSIGKKTEREKERESEEAKQIERKLLDLILYDSNDCSIESVCVSIVSVHILYTHSHTHGVFFMLWCCSANVRFSTFAMLQSLICVCVCSRDTNCYHFRMPNETCSFNNRFKSLSGIHLVPGI